MVLRKTMKIAQKNEIRVILGEKQIKRKARREVYHGMFEREVFGRLRVIDD